MSSLHLTAFFITVEKFAFSTGKTSFTTADMLRHSSSYIKQHFRTTNSLTAAKKLH